jgi:hypothetical protein
MKELVRVFFYINRKKLHDQPLDSKYTFITVVDFRAGLRFPG